MMSTWRAVQERKLSFHKARNHIALYMSIVMVIKIKLLNRSPATVSFVAAYAGGVCSMYCVTRTVRRPVVPERSRSLFLLVFPIQEQRSHLA